MKISKTAARQAVLEWLNANKEKDEESHIKNGCRYGQQDGPDDFIKDCECDELCPRCNGPLGTCYDMHGLWICQDCFLK